MSLDECMRSTTNRQFRMWMEWRKRQWNEPSRADYYLMRIASEVRRSWVAEKDKVQDDHMRIEFEFKEPVAKRPMTREEADRLARRRWGLMVYGAGDKNVRRD